MDARARKYLTILALSISGGSIYLIPYIRYVFYDYQIAAMGITNQQLGLLSTVYAIGCMSLYIPGGLIADRFSAKKSILVSLLSTTALTVAFAFTMNYTFALVAWFLFAFTTTFVFWSSLFKTLRMISGEDEQGRMFGLYYAGNGITGGLVNAIGLWAGKFAADPTGKFFIAVLVYAAATGVAALLILLFLKEDAREKEFKSDEFRFDQVGALIKNPTIWYFALIVFAGYAVFSSSTYCTPYLTEVVGISAEQSGLISVVRTNFMMLLAPVGGFLADKIFKSTSKWFICAFSMLALIYIGVLFIPASASPTFVSLFTLLPEAVGMALYGVIFSIANEAKIPVLVMGTAVGIASIIGYTPDFFMATMFGTWLDAYGAGGYRMIFIFLAGVCVLGIMMSYLIRRRVKKMG